MCQLLKKVVIQTFKQIKLKKVMKVCANNNPIKFTKPLIFLAINFDALYNYE